MLVRENAEKTLGKIIAQAARHNWSECYPVVDGGRIVGVVSAFDDGTGPDVLAGIGTRGAEYSEDRQAWIVSPAASAARALRAIPSERRSEQSRINGLKGGRQIGRAHV